MDVFKLILITYKIIDLKPGHKFENKNYNSKEIFSLYNGK